jgi:hypothetical protein
MDSHGFCHVPRSFHHVILEPPGPHIMNKPFVSDFTFIDDFPILNHDLPEKPRVHDWKLASSKLTWAWKPYHLNPFDTICR